MTVEFEEIAVHLSTSSCLPDSAWVRVRAAAAGFAAAALAACGDGGSGGTPIGDIDTIAPTATLTAPAPFARARL